MKKDSLVDQIGQFTTVPNSVIEIWNSIGLDAFALFVYLRFRSNKQDTCWPSYQTISQETTLTRQRISNAISILETNQLLERRKRFSGSTVYTIKMPISKDVGLMDDPISKDVLLQQSDILTTVVRQVDTNQTHSTRSTETDKGSEQKSMFGALASLCKVDQKLSRGQLARYASELRKAGYTLEDLNTFKAWWYKNDFRGKKGSPPKIATVAELILQAKQDMAPYEPELRTVNYGSVCGTEERMV